MDRMWGWVVGRLARLSVRSSLLLMWGFLLGYGAAATGLTSMADVSAAWGIAGGVLAGWAGATTWWAAVELRTARVFRAHMRRHLAGLDR